MIFVGHLVDSRPDWSLRVEEGVLVVAGGRIVAREGRDKLDDLIRVYELDSSEVVFLKDTQFITPGFIDTHIHASQFPNAGNAAGYMEAFIQL